MNAIPSLVLIFGATFVWVGLTVLVLLRLRRRRRGSSVVASAAPPAVHDISHPRRHWHRIHPAGNSAPAGRHRGIRKVRG
ncbi:hypothetical protein [Arthrobacter sp. AFG7.2]|uniref:hypothetical protein n=1 Tax=Arthrobacter sp. AFG7.2 TaxID=1688693 RepID=UPI0011AF186A|nr:hypothetical protein [Arthrobacter sp. AFG7.2]